MGMIAAGAVLVVPAVASPRAGTAGAKKLAEVKVPLPAPGHAEIMSVTLTVTAPKGKSVGSLTAKAANADQVKKADADAVVALPPASHKRKATLKIYVAMFRGNLAAKRRSASSASVDSMLMPILAPAIISAMPVNRIHLSPVECSSGAAKTDLPREVYKSLVKFSPEKAEHQWDVDANADCGTLAEPIDEGD